MPPTFTGITFAPIQTFIEDSRKLRDLYGSSFILSYLSAAVCKAAEAKGFKVISPALINVTQGTPNRILIAGDFSHAQAEEAFYQAWGKILNHCRGWLEAKLKFKWVKVAEDEFRETPEQWDYHWRREWNLWHNHAWEFFWSQDQKLSSVHQHLEQIKKNRAWSGINWVGESSTLAGTDALAMPTVGAFNPKTWTYHQQKDVIEAFYHQLSDRVGRAFVDYIAEQLKQEEPTRQQLENRYGKGFVSFVSDTLPKLNTAQYEQLVRSYGEGIIDPEEELSIPELTKRLITLEAIATPIDIPFEEVPATFRDLNRLHKTKKNAPVEPDDRWTGWFLGDGDQVGKYIKAMDEDTEAINTFSRTMLNWGQDQLKPSLNNTGTGRVVYAGGDDFFGIFYRTPPQTRFLLPLFNYLGQVTQQTHPNLAAELSKVTPHIKRLGLHKSIKLSPKLRQGLVDTLKAQNQHPELHEHLDYAGLSPQEAQVLFEQPVLQPHECLNWFYQFSSQQPGALWQRHQEQISASVGFVWAAPKVPQREVLQQCRIAEKSAKQQGRDRIALRILFNSGTYLQWVCPWRFLPILKDYRDRNPHAGPQNWSHIYEDVAILEARHAFSDTQATVAQGLLTVYFNNKDPQPQKWYPPDRQVFYELINAEPIDFSDSNWWNLYEGADPFDPKQSQRLSTGILGDRGRFTLDAQPSSDLDIDRVNRAFNTWTINLAKVGFHLCSDI